MPEDFQPAELERHLRTCKVCHDPGKDGGDAVYCPEADMLFRIFTALMNGGQTVLIH